MKVKDAVIRLLQFLFYLIVVLAPYAMLWYSIVKEKTEMPLILAICAYWTVYLFQHLSIDIK